MFEKTPPSKEQYEIVQGKWKKYNDILINISKNLQPLEIALEQQYSDTIKSIAIISGAIASFSLTLFSSAIKKIDDLLIIGVSLLLVNVIITFSHLVRRITRSLQNLKYNKDKFEPIQEIADYSRKFYFGEVSFEEWQKTDEELDKRVKGKIDIPPPNEVGVTHIDEVAVVILGIAVVLVMLSFVIPVITTLLIKG